MTTRWYSFLLAFLSCMIIIIAAPSTEIKKEDATSGEEAKEKRSQEEIMFGNQQNKPASVMDDILSYEDKKDEEPMYKKDEEPIYKRDEEPIYKRDEEPIYKRDEEPMYKKDEEPIYIPVVNSTSETQNVPNEEKTEKDQPTKEPPIQKSEVADRRYDYLDYVDDNSEQRYADNEYGVIPSGATQQTESQAEAVEPQLYSMQDIGDYPAYDFSNALYRRKRNLRTRAIPLRKRSFRTSLKDLLSRRKRLSRRALRLKRQTNVENLLALLGPLSELQKNGRFEDVDQFPPGYGILPVDLPDQPTSDYTYGTYALPEVEDYEPTGLLMDDQEELDLPSYRKEEEPWLYRRHPLYTVRRRSPSYFYPVDYRFVTMPGQKKRSNSQPDQGKWGTVVQAPPNYNPSEDMTRLYALANLLAETEEPEYRYRRSA